MFFRPLLKRIDWLHAWIGMTAGVLVFVVTWTGTIAVFHPVISLWERPEPTAAAPASDPGIDATVQAAFAAHYGDATPSRLTVFLPTAADPSYRISASGGGEPALNAIVAPDGSSLPQPQPGPAALITRLHTDLLLPAPYGIWIVGFSGVVALVLIVSGILLHRHILRDLFALRLFRSSRLALKDIHTLAGTWTLPYFFLLCLSGAVLGFIAIASLFLERVAYDGDSAAARAALSPTTAASGEPAAMTDLDAVVASVRELDRPFEPEGLDVEYWGDAAAVITVRGEPEDQLVWRRRASFDGVTGELITPDIDAANTPVLGVYAMMTPVHYGNFGGLLVRAVYFVLGVVVSFAIGVGYVLWINKRGERHRWLAKAAIGTSAGCLVATALVFPLDLMFRELPGQHFANLELALWLSWLVTLVATLVQRSWERPLIAALHCCALLFAAAGVASAAMLIAAGDVAARTAQVALVVDVALIGLAAVFWLSARWTRRSLGERQSPVSVPARA